MTKPTKSNIIAIKGNIFAAGTEGVVNPVNCVGTMGKGLALHFKRAYPENFKAYKAACDEKEVVPGKMFVFERDIFFTPECIINFPTKRHWRDDSRIEDIESGLEDLIKVVRSQSLRSIAIPPLGCGLGGLHWADVRPLIVKAFEACPGVEVWLFEPR